MKAPVQTPFDSVENAHRYVHLLVEAIAEAKQEIAADIGAGEQSKSDRRMQAMQVVQVKLDQLERHLQTSSRLLNDLRTLRRLLLDERIETSVVNEPAGDSQDEDPAA